MDTWNNFTTWLQSADARPMVFAVTVAFIAIIVASVIAALIARGATRSLIAQRDREGKVAAIAALVDSATEAAVWSSLTPQEQILADRAVAQADIQLRLLPVKSSGIAADWANHQLSELKRNSATFGYELGPVLVEFRSRLVEWQTHPRRAKKIFEGDLTRWTEETRALSAPPVSTSWDEPAATDIFAAPATPAAPATAATTPVAQAPATAPTAPITPAGPQA